MYISSLFFLIQMMPLRDYKIQNSLGTSIVGYKNGSLLFLLFFIIRKLRKRDLNSVSVLETPEVSVQL
jgi:hypothetical protein